MELTTLIRGMSHISNFRDVWYFSFFFQILIEHSVADSEDPDQTLHYVVSDLGQHCLPMSNKKDTMRQIHILFLT